MKSVWTAIKGSFLISVTLTFVISVVIISLTNQGANMKSSRLVLTLLALVVLVGCSDVGSNPTSPGTKLPGPGISQATNEVNLSMPSLTANAGGSLSIPIIMTGHESVGAVSLTVAFDPTVIQILDISDCPNLGLFVSTPPSIANSTGQMKIAWMSPEGSGFPSDRVCALQVAYKGGTSPLRFINKVSGSVVDIVAEKSITVYYTDGLVSSK
jgi:hypothetical protein